MGTGGLICRAPLPEPVERVEPGPVLVFAPHADDEVIGCGGTLALHALQADPVHVVVLFDGTLGAGDAAAHEQLRQREALAAAAELAPQLGFDYSFWSYPEGHEPSARQLEEVSQRIAACIHRVGPRTVFAPWRGEQHVDHHWTGVAVEDALTRARYRAAAWGYEVWTPLFAERVVDVSSVIERKRSALGRHASQLRARDLVHAALGMNAQRSMYLAGGARYGEAFCRLEGRDLP